MSKRKARASGCLIENLARPHDGLPEVRVLNRPGLQEINAALEQAFEIRQQPKEGVRLLGGGHQLELYEEIQVAGCRVEVAASARAEDVETFHPVLGAELFDGVELILDHAMHTHLLLQDSRFGGIRARQEEAGSRCGNGNDYGHSFGLMTPSRLRSS